ncbi:MAG: CBS domain-containing protein [Thermoplasmatota archaeon]
MENFDEYPDIRIQDVMSVNPIIIRKTETVEKAAKLMKETKVGSLLVLDEDGDIEGIVTEMDIVNKTVAEGVDPTEVTVKEIMSHPVHTITGDKDIIECAEMMSKMNIRRLPVMSGDKIIGVITENDILELSPTLIQITREYAKIGGEKTKGLEEYDEPPEIQTSGYCESCDIYSDNLTLKNGQFLCPECI